MKWLTGDQMVGCALATLGAGALLWLWGQAPWVPLWPVIAAVAGMAAAVVIWVSVVPGQGVDGAWSLAGGLVLTAEALWEYAELPVDSRPYQVLAVLVVMILLFFRATRTPDSVRAGVRVGLGTSLVFCCGGTLVFGLNLGQPTQAAVLASGGAFEAFEASQSTDFLVWAVSDFWSTVPWRLAFGTTLGLAAGGLASLWGRLSPVRSRT